MPLLSYSIDVSTPLALVVLGQDNQAVPGASGAGAPVSGAGAGTGAGTSIAPSGTGAPPARGSGFEQQLFLMVMLLVLGMIVFSIMGQRRDRKKREAMISAIKKHDRVQTIGGVIGSVVEVKPDYIVLKVDESSNTRITFSRSAIAQVLTTSPELAPSAKPEQATT